MKNIKKLLYLSPIALLMVGCAGGNNPGIEYAPDMYDSKGYEPYNQLDSNTLNEYGANVRRPVDGTVALGKADYAYALPNTGEGYERSATEVTMPAGLADAECEGKRLYIMYCSPCHGVEGKNDGNVFKRASYLKPGAWGDGYQNDYIKNLADGQIYHTLVYGKNNMGSHASVLTPTQRWQVIAYVRQLSNGNVDCDGSVVVSTDSVSMASDVTAEDVQSEVSDSTKNEEVH
ncbi:cytochrome c [Bacteroidia bacterium]|nr:cytochrome c [Bacteroidia bacterium]